MGRDDRARLAPPHHNDMVRTEGGHGVPYATGIRRAEAAALTLASYNTATRSLRLVGKGIKERTVPVSQAALPCWRHGSGCAEAGPVVLPGAQGRQDRAPPPQLPKRSRTCSNGADSRPAGRCLSNPTTCDAP